MSRHLGWRRARRAAPARSGGLAVVTRPARLGLDLRGGTQIVLEARTARHRRADARHRGPHPGCAARPRRRARRRRADPAAARASGASSSSCPASTTRRRRPTLSGGPLEPRSTPCSAWRTGAEEPTRPPSSQGRWAGAGRRGRRLARLGPPALTGEAVSDARAQLDPQFQTRWDVAIEFRGGRRRWPTHRRRRRAGRPGIRPVGSRSCSTARSSPARSSIRRSPASAASAAGRRSWPASSPRRRPGPRAALSGPARCRSRSR